MNRPIAWTMRGILATLLTALIATPSWAQFTPPASPAYCPWPAWKLPPTGRWHVAHHASGSLMITVRIPKP